MTYKDLVDKIKQITDEHQMLADFGYGDLSDIKSRSELGSSDASYPYLFLNPVPGSRNETTVTYRFNMIAMDVVGLADDYLTTQSDCQQYIDDILARLHLYYTGPNEIYPIITNVTLTPFKERFADVLAGFTAGVEFQLKRPLNDCITPYPTH